MNPVLFDAIQPKHLKKKIKYTHNQSRNYCDTVFDVRGSMHHSTIHKKNPTRCNNISEFLLFHIYMKLNVFRATHRPSSGAYNRTG